MSTRGGRTEVEKKGKISPEHTIDFILARFYFLTQREVRWGAQVKELGGDKRHRSR